MIQLAMFQTPKRYWVALTPVSVVSPDGVAVPNSDRRPRAFGVEVDMVWFFLQEKHSYIM